MDNDRGRVHVSPGIFNLKMDDGSGDVEAMSRQVRREILACTDGDVFTRRMGVKSLCASIRRHVARRLPEVTDMKKRDLFCVRCVAVAPTRKKGLPTMAVMVAFPADIDFFGNTTEESVAKEVLAWINNNNLVKVFSNVVVNDMSVNVN